MKYQICNVKLLFFFVVNVVFTFLRRDRKYAFLPQRMDFPLRYSIIKNRKIKALYNISFTIYDMFWTIFVKHKTYDTTLLFYEDFVNLEN